MFALVRVLRYIYTFGNLALRQLYNVRQARNCSFLLKMARKKRRLEPVTVAATETKENARYEDEFQHTVGSKVEEFGRKFEGQGRNILYGLGALVVIGIIAWFIYAWSSRSDAAAQAALGKAIETSQAQVTESPLPGYTGKTYKTEKERAEAAIAEFQTVVEKHGGDAGEKAKYFIAVNRMAIDRPAALAELEGLAKSNDEVGKMAKFALAQAYASDQKFDQAAAIYSELNQMSDPIIAKDTINFELAKIYEEQGKKQEAADLLFNIVKTANEQKDLDGNPVPLSLTAESANEKLTELDPERAKQLPQAASPSAVNPF